MDERIQIAKFNRNNVRTIEYAVLLETEKRSAIHVFTKVDDGKFDLERIVVRDNPRMTYNSIPHVRALEKVLDMIDTKLREGYVIV